MTKEAIMYLDWVNNFISPERFAEYYQISEREAVLVIEKGREDLKKYRESKEYKY